MRPPLSSPACLLPHHHPCLSLSLLLHFSPHTSLRSGTARQPKGGDGIQGGRLLSQHSSVRRSSLVACAGCPEQSMPDPLSHYRYFPPLLPKCDRDRQFAGQMR